MIFLLHEKHELGPNQILESNVGVSLVISGPDAAFKRSVVILEKKITSHT